MYSSGIGGAKRVGNVSTVDSPNQAFMNMADHWSLLETLLDGLCVVIDLRDAMHIDLPAVDMLARMVADFPTAAPHMPVVILRPDVMPECPVPIALEGLPPLTASCASG